MYFTKDHKMFRIENIILENYILQNEGRGVQNLSIFR